MSKKVERKGSFKSISGDELKDFYSSSNNEKNYNIDPGSFPYTRGIHKNMYRGKLWTMRQFAGFGAPSETNKRFKHLLKQGQTGLSVAFDMPTLMGYDSDHSLSEGEVGMCGVAISSLKDMEILFDGINITSVEQQWLGKQIGYVPQNLSLPRATIEEVICQHEQCKKDAVIKASKMAGVHQTILSLPQGYDSILSVETSQLSPGILQRITLARALYHQPKILIFDEADAYLDKSGKDNYLNLINIATKSGCTVIAATQCQQMLTKANKILLIEQGKDSFFGTFPQFQAFVNQLNQQRKVSNLFNNQ